MEGKEALIPRATIQVLALDPKTIVTEPTPTRQLECSSAYPSAEIDTRVSRVIIFSILLQGCLYKIRDPIFVPN